MPGAIKSPDELLAYRPLAALLAAKGDGVHAVGPEDSVHAALKAMDERHVGFLVVLEGTRLVGVLSERDFARKCGLQGRLARDTRVREIMTREVVSCRPSSTIPECMALMATHHLRHLPVVDSGAVVGVLSIRDLLKETITHHERLIRDLEVEMMTLLNPNVSGY